MAADAETDGQAGYHKVTVEVTEVSEPGTVELATNTAGGTPQYLVDATLTATAKDGDITATAQTFTVDVPNEVDGVTWRWYRGGTEITGEVGNTYTLVQADAGQHIRAVVYYIVDGNTRQENASLTTDYPVLAVRIGDSQHEFDPDTVSLTISEGAKGRNVGAPVTSEDNHGTVRYSLADSGDATTATPRFKIDEKTGQITTNVVLDYEGESAATADDAGSCAGATDDNPDRECTVTVTAKDSTGVDATNSVTVTITITNVNEKPTFSTGEKMVDVPENSTALFSAAGEGYSVNEVGDVTYTAMDPEGLTVTYSLTGPDASKFKISGDPPVLSFVSGPDFEAKASADRDNVYEVTVRATVGGDTGEQMVRVTVDNVDEGPVVSGLSTRDFAENSKDLVATFTADDPEGATPITWAIAVANGDPDGDGPLMADDAASAASFEIDKDGNLEFMDPPDYENPQGAGTPLSNTYNVVVVACDVALDGDGACPASPAGQAGFHKVTVEVTEVSEPGTVELATNTAGGTPQYLVDATLTATAKDGDITATAQTFTVDVPNEVDGVTWRWYRGGTEITGEVGNTYTLVQADADHRIRVEVRYQVDGNTRQENASLTTDYPVLAVRIGDSQHEFDPDTVSLTISEGAKGRNVGAPVTSEDNHGTVRYSLADSGDATTATPRFKIDEKTGQITTNVVLDYEGESAATADDAGSCAGATDDNPDRECTVTVTAKDSTGVDATNSVTVTITITNVNEKPTFSTGEKMVDVPENSTALFSAAGEGYSVNEVGDVTYTAMDPEGLTVTYSLTGPDASKFKISGSPPVLSFVSGPDFEAKASADRDNVYEVTVRATVGGDTGEQMVRVTVDNVDEAPEIIVTVDGVRISGDSRASVAEGDTAVATYTARGENAARARWTLEGADAGDFRVSPTSGASVMLMFRSSPDYEAPADADTDNVYMVTLKATEGTDTDTHEVTVTVTDVVEDVPVIGGTLLDRSDTNTNGQIEKSEVIRAFQEYVSSSGQIDKSEIIEVFQKYIRDSANS